MLEYFFHRKQEQLGSALPDLNRVIKASQSILSEIILERLLPKLMYMILEMTEATKGAIVLAKEIGLEITVIGTSKPSLQTSLVSISANNSSLLPLSVINYVVQTKEAIILNYAAKQGNFTTDPYIKVDRIFLL